MSRFIVAISRLPLWIAAVGIVGYAGCAAQPGEGSSTSNVTEICVPRCDAIGSRSEGWYDCNGSLIKWAACSECSAVCSNQGTRSEGWYSSCDDKLIAWDQCASAPEPTACLDAGGACVGVTPSNCPDGEWGDAELYSCGEGVGVGCCLPTEPAQNGCEEAGGVCVGLAPANCQEGEWGDASLCGGMLGTGCCLPL